MNRREAIQSIALTPVIMQGMISLGSAQTKESRDNSAVTNDEDLYWKEVESWESICESEFAYLPATKLREAQQVNWSAFQNNFFGEGSAYHRGALGAVWNVLTKRKLCENSQRAGSDLMHQPEKFFSQVFAKASLSREERQILRHYQARIEAKHTDALKAEIRAIISRIMGEVLRKKMHRE